MEWAFPAHRGYVRAEVNGKQTEDAVRVSQDEAKADTRFTRIESLLLKQNVDTIDAKLKIMRPALIQLMDLLGRNPGDPTIRVQIVSLQADIAETEQSLQAAKCAYESRNAPNFGCAQ
jgi:hypothetical protein